MKRVLLCLLLAAGLAGSTSGVAIAGDAASKVDGKSPEWLKKKLKTADDVHFKVAIIREMGDSRDPSLLPVLLHAAGDAERKVRKEALHSLAAFGPQLADPGRDAAYMGGLQDADVAVVKEAQKALTARVQAAAEPGMDNLVKQLTRYTKTGASWQTRKAAVELLERIPDDLAGPRLDQTLTEVAQRETHPEVRRSAVIALGSRGVESAKPLLSRLKNTDDNEQVRLAAEDALRRIGGTASSVVVAVMPFETRAKKLAQHTESYQDFFTAALSSASVAKVVERKQIASVLSELHFQDAHIDDGKALKIGKMLRAGQVVTGSLQVTGDEVTCLSKRIDVATGEVWAAQPTVGSAHDLEALKRTCARRLVGSF